MACFSDYEHERWHRRSFSCTSGSSASLSSDSSREMDDDDFFFEQTAHTLMAPIKPHWFDGRTALEHSKAERNSRTAERIRTRREDNCIDASLEAADLISVPCHDVSRQPRRAHRALSLALATTRSERATMQPISGSSKLGDVMPHHRPRAETL